MTRITRESRQTLQSLRNPKLEPVVLVLATLSGLIPSITAYRTDMAEPLAR